MTRICPRKLRDAERGEHVCRNAVSPARARSCALRAADRRPSRSRRGRSMRSRARSRRRRVRVGARRTHGRREGEHARVERNERERRKSGSSIAWDGRARLTTRARTAGSSSASWAPTKSRPVKRPKSAGVATIRAAPVRGSVAYAIPQGDVTQTNSFGCSPANTESGSDSLLAKSNSVSHVPATPAPSATRTSARGGSLRRLRS